MQRLAFTAVDIINHTFYSKKLYISKGPKLISLICFSYKNLTRFDMDYVLSFLTIHVSTVLVFYKPVTGS